jgi:hypothetical protein
MGALRPVPRTEFRGDSRRASHFARRYNMFKMLPGGIETHSKTPIKVCVFFINHIFSTKTVRILKMDSPEGETPESQKALTNKQ